LYDENQCWSLRKKTSDAGPICRPEHPRTKNVEGDQVNIKRGSWIRGVKISCLNIVKDV